MPLNGISKSMLASLNATPIDWGSITVHQFRLMSSAMELPAESSDDVVHRDADANGVPVRIYRRSEAEGNEPVLVFYHGGGYIACGISSHERLCARLTRLGGCAVVSVNYQLAPEHVFPAAVDDALTALRWVGTNGGDFGLDTQRIAVGGDSAGGSLAAVIALRVHREGGPRIAHQLLFYPGTDLVLETESKRLFADGYFLDSGFSELCISAYLPDAGQRSDPWASPLRAEDLTGLPPATIITAECDPLRDEGKAYAERLTASGGSVQYTEFPGVFHGFVSMFGTIPEADQAIDKAAAALHDAFAMLAA